MDSTSIAIAIIGITLAILCIALVVDAYQQHKKIQEHLNAYAKLRKHWEEKRIKEHEEAQADQVQPQ